MKKYPTKKPLKKHMKKFADQDYLNKLSPEELEFIQNFNEEYYNSTFEHEDSESLHKTDELKRECYSRQNSAYRDVTNPHTKRVTFDIDEMSDHQLPYEDPTEAMILLIDIERALEKKGLNMNTATTKQIRQVVQQLKGAENE